MDIRPSCSFIASCARAACAPKAVTMVSTRLQGRAPSEPGFEIQREVPLFSSQFHHFWTLSETDNNLECLNETLLYPFMRKKLGPSKVGLNRKRSDFSDLPNGLMATSLASVCTRKCFVTSGSCKTGAPSKDDFKESNASCRFLLHEN